MALSREQKQVLETILSVANTAPKGVRARIRKAIVETGIVEANLRNPKGGDGTSSGFRQETKSSYPHVDRQNVREAAKRFVQEATPVAMKYKTAGQLAQAVQRSAYPARYDQHSKEAQQLVRLYDRRAGNSGGGAVSSDGSPVKVTPATVKETTTPGVDNSAARQQLLQAYVQQRGNPDALLNLAAGQAQAADVPSQSSFKVKPGKVTGGGGGGSSVAGSSGGGDAKGQVKLASGADRGGVSTQPIVKKAVAVVAGKTHHPVTITTGTNHSQMTVNGNVSDHWSGHAADIAVPVDSHQGDVIAAAALERLAGVPASKAREMVRHGGLWTFTPKNGPVAGHRIQIIWRTNEGGNHHNHVHIGVR